MERNPPTVLIVEDDPVHMELLSYNVQAAGFSVVSAYGGREALDMAKDYSPDIVLLDWMLPEMSGIELCRQMRASHKWLSTPIIMVSAKGDEEDRIRGLEAGADDYVVKPFSVSELVARLRANLRRVRPTSVGQRLAHEDIVLDAEQHRVYRNGQVVKLGPTEFRLLATLIERPGRVWSRTQLLDRVWGRNIFVEVRTVDVHVGRLRKALKRHGDSDPVRTVRGVGYALG